ncbi:Threonine synthase [Venturia nashicola]|nr:Threonine synthase [Venturia nashicola]
MKLKVLLVGFFGACGFAATLDPRAVRATGAVTDDEIVDTLLRRDAFLLPKNSHKMLVERTQTLNKRNLNTQSLAAAVSGNHRTRALSEAPQSTVPEVQDSPGVSWKEAKRTKIRYGPYRIPPTSEDNWESKLLGVRGMTDTLAIRAKKPCEGECMMLSLSADLEYADGSPGNNSNGAWLHHIVLLNAGPEVREPTCDMPRVENIFMSGNERSVGGWALENATIKSGYTLTPNDRFILSTELMNMDDKEKWAWVTLTYEYIDGPTQSGYKQGKIVWQTIGVPIGACGRTWTNPFGETNLTFTQRPKTQVFTEHSVPWTATRDAWLLGTGGHMHDGGVSTEIFVNKQRVCNSVPKYSKSAKGMSKATSLLKRQAMDSSNLEIEHIESQDFCDFQDGIAMKKGEEMYLQASYDFITHPGMKDKNGDLDEIMGIVGSLVAF